MDVTGCLDFHLFDIFCCNLQMPGVTVQDVCPQKFVVAFAAHLKK